MNKTLAKINEIVQKIVPPILLWVSGYFFSMLWFMLMADTLASGAEGAVIPEATLSQIRGFYQTIFGPMTWFVKIVFAVGLLSMTLQLFVKATPLWIRVVVFVTNVPPIFMAAFYIIPMTDRFIANSESLEIQSQYARTIHNAHLIAASCVALMIVLQLIAVVRMKSEAAPKAGKKR